MNPSESIAQPEDLVLVTGATGFVGLRVVERLLGLGYRNVRCLVRPSSDVTGLEQLADRCQREARIELVRGNLLSRPDCLDAAKDAVVVYHLAVGAGGKSFPDLFMNSVLTTRNLLDAALHHHCVRRFVNVSSFAVYSNRDDRRPPVLDESSAVEEHPELRGEAYCYAKVKQDQIVMQYGIQHNLPYAIVRPGVVYGPGKKGIVGRVGIGTFGIFLHLAGGNRVPLTYVENCAEAIVLAGLKPGIDGEVFNIIDDDLPTSRQILRLYKSEVQRFRSIYVPHLLSYLLFYAWEKYSSWSQGQLPPTFNRRAWHAYWKGNCYSNLKLKQFLGWKPRVTTTEGIQRYLAACREDS